MTAIVTSIIAVLGTLLGSAATYLIQRSSVREQQLHARTENLRKERVDACAAYGALLLELRNSRTDRHYADRDEREDRELVRLRDYEICTSADGARLRVQLLVDDPELRNLAVAALQAVTAIRATLREDAFLQARRDSNDAIATFVDVCRDHLALSAG